ncbi:MAG: DUF4373 domain-containing protein [Tannerellaceae bacterium]|nr:DUF4373 domain-containing protein [Tannerellaceae bacterium]
MARPVKRGLSYFPLDTDFLTDRKIQRLARKYQHTGICTYLTLLCEIYRTNGYYIPYSPELCFDIGFTLQMEDKLVAEIIDFCLEVHLFNKPLFELRRVLTSEAIQQRYLVICKKKLVTVDPALFIGVPVPETGVSDTKTGVSDTKTGVSEAITPVSGAITPVSGAETTPKGKGKESEIKSNKENGEKIDKTTGAQRMAELIRMYQDATGDCPDA